jgi:hypothetical protein
MQYVTEMYLTLLSYMDIALYGLTIVTCGGGIVLLVVMADNSGKGTMDFSASHMRARVEEFGYILNIWKKCAVLHVLLLVCSVFAPSEIVVKSWIHSDTVLCSE